MQNAPKAVLIAIAVAALMPQPGDAQAGSGGLGGYQQPGAASSNMPAPPEQNDQQRLFRENVYSQHKASSATAAQKATALQEVTSLLAGSSFACKPTEAAQVAAGPETVNGKTLDTKSYEVACDNGVGYFLIAQPPEKPAGFSCFAAEAARAADVAAGRKPGTVCTLPVNADVKTMAASVLSRLGKPCQIQAQRWIGQNAKVGAEFVEAACADGSGYVIRFPQPVSTVQPGAFACADAAKQGIPCKLSNAPTAIITIQTFKDALAQKGVACDASDVRVIGKENVLKRHVVEFRCPQQPKGLIAFIPLSDSTAPFQTMDCATAAKKMHVECKLSAAQ